MTEISPPPSSSSSSLDLPIPSSLTTSLLSLTSRLSTLESLVSCTPLPNTLAFPALPSHLVAPPPEKRSSIVMGMNQRGSIVGGGGLPLIPPSPLPASSTASSASSSLTSSISPSNSTSPSTSIPLPFDQTISTFITKFDELNKVFTRVEDNVMRQFFVKFTQLEGILERKLSLGMSDISTEVKGQVVLSSYEQLKLMISQLENIKILSQQMDKAPIPSIEFHQSIQTKHEKMVQQLQINAAQLHIQIHKFATIYDEYVEMISQKFVNWNSKLERWMDLIEAVGEKKGIKFEK